MHSRGKSNGKGTVGMDDTRLSSRYPVKTTHMTCRCAVFAPCLYIFFSRAPPQLVRGFILSALFWASCGSRWLSVPRGNRTCHRLGACPPNTSNMFSLEPVLCATKAFLEAGEYPIRIVPQIEWKDSGWALFVLMVYRRP